jgi:Protein of unknown function
MVSAKTRSMAFAAMSCDFCGFLEWVSQMGLTDVEIPNRTRDGGSRKRVILSLAELSPDEVHQNLLWDRAVPLSAEEHERCGKCWRWLCHENAPFRVVEGDAIISASMEIYDDVLLSCVPTGWRRAAQIIGERGDEGVFRLHDDPIPDVLLASAPR